MKLINNQLIDIYVRPPVEKYQLLDYPKAEEIAQIGRLVFVAYNRCGYRDLSSFSVSPVLQAHFHSVHRRLSRCPRVHSAVDAAAGDG